MKIRGTASSHFATLIIVCATLEKGKIKLLEPNWESTVLSSYQLNVITSLYQFNIAVKLH